MFWGLIMEPKRRYSEVVSKRFHVSMAALDSFTADDSPAQCMLYYEGRNYLLCTLQKNQQLQCALDLNFEEGDEVGFASNGNANIHLSGYFLDDDELEKEEDDLKAMEEILNTNNKRFRTVNKPEMPLKKSRTEQLLDEVDNYNSADDMNFSDIFNTSDGDDDAEEEEESDGSDEEDGVEESDEEEVSAEEEQEDDSEEEIIKPKVNGTSPKQQKKQKPSEKPKPKSKQTPKEKQELPTKPGKQTPAAGKKQVEGGVIIEDLSPGMGKPASIGKHVIVKYEGRFKSNNKLFDSSSDKGFKFRLGRQEVIKGWDVGVVGMKVGGKRRITCPPNMAYGAKGAPPAIPPNSTLVFQVELIKVL